MATTHITTETADQSTERDTTARPVFWKVGLLAGVVASAATTLIVVTARAGDVAVDVDGEQIPLLGFAQLTMVGALIGIVLARVLARRASQPRRTFVVTTVTLTALSVIPDFLIDASNGTKLTLILTHVVAAAIIIPALASHFD